MEKSGDYEMIVREGAAAQEIILHTERESVDIIMIKGTRGRKRIINVLLGSTSEKVVKGSPSPVLVGRLLRKDSSSLSSRLAL